MDVLALRTLVQATLGDVLGTYTLANGVETPAISVRPPGVTLERNQRVEGLECVLIAEPEPIELRQYQQQVAFHRWTVQLLDWDGTSPLKQAAGLLLWSFPGSEAAQVPTGRNAGPLAQMRVFLQTAPDFEPQPPGNTITTLSGLNITTLAGDPLITL